VAAKTLKGAQTSILVGLAAALVATLIGTVLGALAGWFGGVVDDLANWFYSVFTSVPTILLVLAIAAVLGQRSLANVVVILGLTTWTGVFRLVRAEYLKHKTREYVRAADAIGASAWRRIAVHVFPQHQPRRAGPVFAARGELHQIRGDPVVPRLRCAGRRSVVGHDAHRGAKRSADRQVVAAGERHGGDGGLRHALSLLADAIRDALDPRLKGR
jgi:ABC-type dipeptide/oligopeptide/nickel transport system permease subunit